MISSFPAGSRTRSSISRTTEKGGATRFSFTGAEDAECVPVAAAVRPVFRHSQAKPYSSPDLEGTAQSCPYRAGCGGHGALYLASVDAGFVVVRRLTRWVCCL